MVFEGDFVGGQHRPDTKAKIGTDAKVFPFPAVGAARRRWSRGGDAAVALKDAKGAQALLTFLASTGRGRRSGPSAGGFLSPNKDAGPRRVPERRRSATSPRR